MTSRLPLIITGAAGGIGSVVSAHFARAGYSILLVDRPGEALEALSRALSCPARSADLTDAVAVRTLVDAVVADAGGVGGLIHCVGGFEMAPIDAVDTGAYDRMFPLNMQSIFLMVQAVAPLLKEQESGFIAGFSSAPAWEGAGPGAAVYAASKAAVATFLRSVERELSPHGVQVSICFPMAIVDTPGNRAAMPDSDRQGWLSPESIARSLLYAASSREGRLRELPIWP